MGLDLPNNLYMSWTLVPGQTGDSICLATFLILYVTLNFYY